MICKDGSDFGDGDASERHVGGAPTHLLCVFKAEGVSHDLRDRFVTLDESLLVLLPLFEVRFEAEEGLLRIRRAQQNAKRGYDVVQRLHLAVL